MYMIKFSSLMSHKSMYTTLWPSPLLQVSYQSTILLLLSNPSLYVLFQGKVYLYDKVLKPSVTQEYVYNTVAKPIVAGKSLAVLASRCGFSCCVETRRLCIVLSTSQELHLQLHSYRVN